jgi:hypothetical protein
LKVWKKVLGLSILVMGELTELREVADTELRERTGE